MQFIILWELHLSLHFPFGKPTKLFFATCNIQKQPPRGVPRKRCSENIPQIYRRTPMPKCDFNKVLKSHFGMGVLLKFSAYFQNTFFQEHCRDKIQKYHWNKNYYLSTPTQQLFEVFSFQTLVPCPDLKFEFLSDQNMFIGFTTYVATHKSINLIKKLFSSYKF